MKKASSANISTSILVQRRPMWPEAAISRWITDTEQQLCSPPPSPNPSPSPNPTHKHSTNAHKRRRSEAMEEDELPSQQQHHQHHPTLESDTTPRPRKAIRTGLSSHPLASHTMFPSPPQPPQRHQPSPPKSTITTSSTSEASAGSGSMGVKRKRGSRSPTKRLTDREYNTTLPTERRPIKNLADVPPSLREMVAALSRLGGGKGVLHERDEDLLPRLSYGLDPEKDAAILARGPAATARDHLGRPPAWDTIAQLERKAERNTLDGSSESAWNVEVHGPLLEAALLGSAHRDALDVRDITTARIHPASLLGDLTSITAADSRRVDFCVAMSLDRATDKSAMQRVTSLNHTDYNPMRRQPIAISIETKSYRSDDPQAILQLTTWGCAQVVFLQNFGRPDMVSSPRVIRPPALPMIVVAGHSWTLHLLHVNEQGNEATLWTGLEIGNTVSAAGIYAIVACLQYLFDWVQTVYRPWFKEHILTPLVNGAGGCGMY